jgi:predicted TPR repeat methyltransferase
MLRARGSGKFKKTKLLELSGERVALVGCGSGKYLEFCISAGRKALGVDISAERVVQASERSGGRAALADALALPFADGSFDTVVLWDVLEHVADDCAALKESLRVARRNVLISVPGEDTTGDYSSGVTFRTYTDQTHLRYYNRQRLESLLSLCAQQDYTIEKFDRARPALLYHRVGIPRPILSILDRLLWLLSSKSDTFMRNYFVEIRLAGPVTGANGTN